MPPPPPRVIKTWYDLRRESRELRDFYRAALEVCDDIVTAADLRDEDLLAAVLTKHSNLRAREPFRVSKELFEDHSPMVLN